MHIPDILLDCRTNCLENYENFKFNGSISDHTSTLYRPEGRAVALGERETWAVRGVPGDRTGERHTDDDLPKKPLLSNGTS